MPDKKPLYCYILRSDPSFKLEFYTIYNYSPRFVRGNWGHYTFESKLIGRKSGKEYVDFSRMDKFRNGRLYTFNSNRQFALDLISEKLERDFAKHEKEFYKSEKLIDQWNEFLEKEESDESKRETAQN